MVLDLRVWTEAKEITVQVLALMQTLHVAVDYVAGF